MINRELIRIKIVQLTYAYYQNGHKNIDTAEKELFFSLSKAYDLYNYLLGLIVAITREERRLTEIASRTAELEGKEKPTQKFAFNRFAVQLEENKMLNKYLEIKKLSWVNDTEYIRKLCSQIKSSQIFKDYLEETEESYEADREVWRKLYKNLLQGNEELNDILEEKSLYWNDDKDIVDTFVLKTIKRFDPANKDEQELLPEFDNSEDKDFAVELFRKTITNGETYQQYMSDASHHWDFSRLAYMDVVIMQIAIAEMLNFQNIPVSVTINEYVNLAKIYSTPRSSGYINGMLDTIARHLINTGLMLKPMNVKSSKSKEAKQTDDNQ